MTQPPRDDASANFQTIWEHVECGICIVDAFSREILAINPVAARMFGDNAEKILGKRCHKFICPAEENSCPIMDKNQVVDRSERKFIKADGTAIPIVKSVAKITYNNRPALLESFTDISNLKKAEEELVTLRIAEQANRAKSDFLSRMSHEMRTPMNAIIGMAKIAEGTSDIDKLRYCLSTIRVSAAHLLGLINDVLDMAKIEAGKLDLDHAPLRLESMLMKVCALIAERAEQSGIEFVVSYGRSGPGIEQNYIGDELRLAQVLTNLLSNAVKFTPKGGRITLTTEALERQERASFLRFTIADSGIGMTEEQIGRLFNAFEQADVSITRRFGGTGLGLAISRNIVEAMNGRIEVASEPGAGSTFIVEVELERAFRQERETPVSDVIPPQDVRLLLAAGNWEIRRRFHNLCKYYGFKLEEAEDGESAARLARVARDIGRPHHAIFIEHEPLYLDAVKTAALITGRKPDGAAGPANGIDGESGNACEPDAGVVVLSSFLKWNAVDREARAAGVSRFVSLPLFPSTVLTAIRESLKQSRVSECLPEGEVTPDLSGVTLLLAEDVEINQEIFLALLEPTKIHIDVVENGRLAVERFKAEPARYDAVIMDVQMPEMDGYEATAAIRALPLPRAATVPIIAMTANAFREDIEKCLASGMSDHLAKPIDESAVINKIVLHCVREKSPVAHTLSSL